MSEEFDNEIRDKYLELTKDSKYEMKFGDKEPDAYVYAYSFMFIKGLEWLEAHPDYKVKQHGIKGLVGLSFPSNEDTKQLEQYLIWACKLLGHGGPTGFQIQIVVSNLRYASEHGFDKWKK